MLGAQESLEETVVLRPSENFDLTKLRCVPDYQQAANNTDSLQAVEDCMQVWIKQIEQVCVNKII